MARRTYLGILGFFMIIAQLSLGWYFFMNTLTIYRFSNTGKLPSEREYKKMRIVQFSMFIFAATITAVYLILNQLINEQSGWENFLTINFVF